MSVIQTQQEIITLEQYEALPEDTRAEVFEGQVYYMASASQVHQTILTELIFSIRSYLKAKVGGCVVFPAPFDVKLSDKLDIKNPIIRINTVLKDYSSTKKVTILPRIYHD